MAGAEELQGFAGLQRFDKLVPWPPLTCSGRIVVDHFALLV